MSIDQNEKMKTYEDQLQKLLIENQKLIDVNESLRSKLDQQDLNQNGLLQNQYQNMKVRLNDLLKENQKLVDNLDEREEDDQTWRKKYDYLNTNYQQQIDELKKQFEFQKDISVE